MAKFCTNCGSELDDKAIMCPKCGVALVQVANQNNKPSSNGTAIAGFILSFFIPLLGLIFSIIGLKKSKETNSGKGLSTAGIIISCIAMVISIIVIAVSFSTVNDTINEAKRQVEYDKQYYNNNY